MERWGAKGAAPERPGRTRRHADQPSFSSTLLDAIYRSMDEPDDDGALTAAATTASNSNTKKREAEALLRHSHHCYNKASLAESYRYRSASSRVTTAAPLSSGRHAATTSSSSDCSSYGEFSSSEAGSSSQHHHRRLRPIRTSVAAAPPAAAQEKKARKPGAAIRAKLRDLRSKPASPGARLAGFLNSIFAAGKRGGPATTPRAAESACSTASSSSYSRSCLSKTPSSTRGQQPNKRTVRFLDSGDAVEEAPASVPTTSSVERRSCRVQVGVAHMEQMLLRRMEMESDDEDDDEESSDASSDLFELENLAAISAPAAAAYRDELPVYETTTRVRGIGHGHGRSTRVA